MHAPNTRVVNGSIRQRGVSLRERRVYSGTNPGTGKRRYRTATVVGNRAGAERGLAELVASVRSERSIGSGATVSELLEAWIVAASGSWAPTTIRQTRSVVDWYLRPSSHSQAANTRYRRSVRWIACLGWRSTVM